ncbi:hypothetical protein JCM10450v2_000629 [Rhodotorula kratochvilovae]
MDGSIAVSAPPPSQTTTTPEQPPATSAPSPSSSSTPSGIALQPSTQDGQPTARATDEQGAGALDKPKPRKLRQPRISEACIRCKSRKQRCVRGGPGACVNCEGAGTEARRKNARKIVEPSASASSSIDTHAAPSPSSLQHLLSNEGPPAFAHPYTRAPYGQHPHLSSHRPAFPPPPPPPPAAHSPYDPSASLAHHSPMHGSPPAVLSAPVSDIRSGQHVAAGSPSLSPVARPSPSASDGVAFGAAAISQLSAAAQTPGHGSSGDGMTVEYDDEDDEGDEDEEEGWHDQAARGVAFLSLSANGNPTYVGPSSGFSWARMVLGGIAGATASESGNASRPTHLDTSQPFQSGAPLPKIQLGADALAGVSDELADMILSECYRHIQPRYAFLDWLFVHEIWQHRIAITRSAAQPNASRMMKTSAFFIWILFAIGSRFCQKSAVPNLAAPEAYYAKAMEHLETIVGLHDLKNVQALMLMVMYSFRSNEAPGVWFLVGIILRVCCSLGLHRRVPPVQARRMSPYILQLRRRIFWSAYTLDRMMAMSLGRPCGIADHDCDIELPFDFDCIATAFDLQNPPQGPTSMTSSILFTKLMRIESIIQKQAYRVDEPSTERPEAVLRLIDEWEAQIPAVASDPSCWHVPCCSREWFLARSADARLYLLRPLTANPAAAEPSHIRLVAKYAAEACEIQKRFHQSSTPLALEALRSIFLTGLTLLHAVQLDRHAIPLSTLQRAIRANSNTMFLYTQAFPGAAAYSEVFEELANAVLDKLSMSPETAASAPPPAALTNAAATPLFTSLWDDLPTMMANDTEDSFLALLESLGVPTSSLGPSGGGNSSALLAAGAGGLDLAELAAFAPASGLEAEPFALGSQAGGIW